MQQEESRHLERRVAYACVNTGCSSGNPGKYLLRLGMSEVQAAWLIEFLGKYDILFEQWDVDAKVIARGTPGFSGADLANLVNEAALFAARSNKRMVAMKEFEQAKDKILMGVERSSTVMDDKEKLKTAAEDVAKRVKEKNVSLPNYMVVMINKIIGKEVIQGEKE